MNADTHTVVCPSGASLPYTVRDPPFFHTSQQTQVVTISPEEKLGRTQKHLYVESTGVCIHAACSLAVRELSQQPAGSQFESRVRQKKIWREVSQY